MSAFTASDLVAFIPEVWTPIVNEEFFFGAVFSNHIRDLSPWAQDGGDIFHVPDLFTNSLSVQTQSTQGAALTSSAATQVDVTLTVNTHKYLYLVFGDKDIRQMARKDYGYDYQEFYARKAARTLVDQTLETDIPALWSSLTTSINDTANAATDLDVRKTIQKLAAAKVQLDPNEVAFFVHHFAWWNQLIAIQKYYDSSMAGVFALQRSQAAGLTRTGMMQNDILGGQTGTNLVKPAPTGFLYGLPVYATGNVVDTLQTFRNMLLHKDCLGFATQTPLGGGLSDKVRIQSGYLPQNLAAILVADIIYGTGVLRNAVGCVMNTNDAATTS